MENLTITKILGFEVNPERSAFGQEILSVRWLTATSDIGCNRLQVPSLRPEKMLLSRCKAWLSVVSAAVGSSCSAQRPDQSSVLDPRSSIVDERTLTAAAAAAAALRFLLAAPQHPSQQLPTFMSWSWIQIDPATRLRATRGQSARVRVCKMSTVGANGPTCGHKHQGVPAEKFLEHMNKTEIGLRQTTNQPLTHTNPYKTPTARGYFVNANFLFLHLNHYSLHQLVL